MMGDELTAQEWAELAHLVNVATHLQPNLEPLRNKVRKIAVCAQAGWPIASTIVAMPMEAIPPDVLPFIRNGGAGDV